MDKRCLICSLGGMIIALDHIQLAMPAGGEATAIAFFAGLLGFAEEPKPWPLSERGGCWFASGTCTLHIGVDPAFVPQKKAHPAFLCEDIDHLAARLVANGCVVQWDHDLPKRKRFYTSDPFGNRLEFIQDGDGFTQKSDIDVDPSTSKYSQ